MKNKKIRIPIPEKHAVMILLTELPVILLGAVCLLIEYLSDRAADPVGAGAYYTELLPYIAVSVLVCIGTALAADLCDREKKKRDP